MEKLKFILVLTLLPLLPGCEEIVGFDQGATSVDGVTINALAAGDTVFSASVSRAYPFYRMEAIGGDVFWMYEGAQKEQYDLFFKDSAVIRDAVVQISVNDAEEYTMSYDPETFNYKSQYVPKEGDKIAIRVETSSFPTAVSRIEIPQSARIEVVSYEKVYSANNDNFVEGGLYDHMGKDTVARITLKIADPVKEKNFYRLKVRGYALSSYEDGEVVYIHNDIFSSADIIFKDEQLTKEYRGWPAYFSNVFSDQLFNGREYEFTVESRLRKGTAGSNYVVVELQSITGDLYSYLKSVMLYRITPQDSYTEPIMIYSNIEGGWGIFGGVSTDRHIISL